jgi:hypothetical protein
LRFIVSSPPGGANDILARTIGLKLAAMVGQQVVVDNRAGAGGIIAAELAAKAAPDGHTLLFATDSTLTVNPQLHRNLPYDPERDFTEIRVSDNFCNHRTRRDTRVDRAAPESRSGRHIGHGRRARKAYCSGLRGHCQHAGRNGSADEARKREMVAGDT